MSENVPQKAPQQKPKRTRPDKAEQNSVHTEAGDNKKYLMHNMAVNALADTPLDMTNEKAVAERVGMYFQLCATNDMKPSVAAFAMALGVNRVQLWKWLNGEVKYIPENVRKLLERAYNLLNAQMEDYMQNGKINPVAGIFLMKNNMGYTDKQEVVLTPNNPLGEMQDRKQLEEKYLASIPLEAAESDF